MVEALLYSKVSIELVNVPLISTKNPGEQRRLHFFGFEKIWKVFRFNFTVVEAFWYWQFSILLVNMKQHLVNMRNECSLNVHFLMLYSIRNSQYIPWILIQIKFRWNCNELKENKETHIFCINKFLLYWWDNVIWSLN